MCSLLDPVYSGIQPDMSIKIRIAFTKGLLSSASNQCLDPAGTEIKSPFSHYKLKTGLPSKLNQKMPFPSTKNRISSSECICSAKNFARIAS